MRKLGIGALLVEPGASLDYFTGVQWWRSERLTAAVIPAEGQPVIVTPFFERPSVAESLKVPAEIRVWQEDEDPTALVASFLRERRAERLPVAIEETVRFFAVDGLRRHLPEVRAANGNSVVRPLRMVKSAAEIALMQRAAELTLQALRQTHAEVSEGMTNGQIGERFEHNVAALGGEAPWSLVLIDEASALPHGTGKPQQVKRGSTVLMDCGCGVHGYQADISRTFVWGAEPTAEQRRVWEQVRRGQDIAFAAAKVGVPAGRVDDAVRGAYTNWGYGPGYALPGLSHRTGHGIGMEGHEPVNLVHGETRPLAPGMCFSNEPGIYLPGKFGVRLEDCFHMTPSGPKYFTTPPPSIDRPFG
jgi:Xaa-Pro dipeptidase